ncbi:MAG: NAD(P)H-binding protein [Microbacterium sp.]|uniref:NAD(P)-dependent oxidoreductase n=1 Tax=Microbacterium sp. TaxID=51671 RepID=UPI0027224A8C|nr:NAD(P)H-binding protein [Microbacterium sp.]MDO8384291.1 NAD(P)H-binding protein [Microbacterium sp.]
MSRIAVIGGTGYAGSHIVAEAVDRGHTVLSVARTAPSERVTGVTYIEGTLMDVPGLVAEIQGAEVVVVSVPARGEMAGLLRPAVAELVATLQPGTRIGVIGGAGGSLSAPEGPRVIDLPSFNDEYKPEAFEAIGILDDLQASDASIDWFYLHPAGGFGVWNPGERTGTYRDGGEVIVTDADGESFISGADLAVVVVDEIESPKHSRERFTVGY